MGSYPMKKAMRHGCNSKTRESGRATVADCKTILVAKVVFHRDRGGTTQGHELLMVFANWELFERLT